MWPMTGEKREETGEKEKKKKMELTCKIKNAMVSISHICKKSKVEGVASFFELLHSHSSFKGVMV